LIFDGIISFNSVACESLLIATMKERGQSVIANWGVYIRLET